MSKKQPFFIVFLAVSAVLFAQIDTSEFSAEAPPPPPPQNEAPVNPAGGDESEGGETGEKIKEKEAIKELLSNNGYISRHLEPYRRFTWGSGLSFGIASDFMIGVYDVLANGDTKYKKNGTFTLDLTDVANDRIIKSKGVNLYTGIDLNPLNIAWNGKNDDGTFKNSGWGLSIGAVDARVDMNLSRELILFMAEGNKNPDTYSTVSVSGAAFVETLAFNYNRRGISKRLSLSITPAHYIPLFYVPKSDLTIHVQTDPEIFAEYEGKVDVWSGIDIESKTIDWNSGGVDLTLNAELAVLPRLDIGLTATHIPIAPAHLTSLTRYEVSGPLIGPLAEGESVSDLFSGSNEITLPDFNNPEKISGDRMIIRPMRFDSYFLFRPFRNDAVVLRPNLGMTLFNPSGEEYVNYGIGTDFNAGRWFTLSFFTGTYDGLFHNKLKFDFHWRFLQMFAGLELASQDFRRSWEMKGAGVSLGCAWGF
jgi:hypothetical protein